MASTPQQRTQWLTIRMTRYEYKLLEELAKNTIHSSLSDYSRRTLLQKPVSLLYRNQSLDDFQNATLQMRKDLQLIRCGVDQAIFHCSKRQPNSGPTCYLFFTEQDRGRLIKLHEQLYQAFEEANRIWSQG